MSSDWEEVKKLAADFQRTQLSDTLQRLSERNCIEIIKKLQQFNLLEIIFTSDGREYLTPDHLIREIEDELYVNNGRIAIPDLANILNVDYAHCEAKSHQLARESHGEINIVIGQLVTRQYKDILGQEIDLKLQEIGFINIGELAKVYDLPTEFLENLIRERLGTIISGKQDPNDCRLILTESYLSQFESRVTGVMSACTRPVSVSLLLNRYKFPERIFNTTMSNLISSKRLSGVVSARTYVPEIYARTQNEYVNNFYKQNGYLDYSTLSRLGISNPQSYLYKKFSNDLCYLESCAVGQLIMFQVESSIEECLTNDTWVDLVTLLPSMLSQQDINMLINKTLEQNKNLSDSAVVFCHTIVASRVFVNRCLEYFGSIIKKKVEHDFNSGLLFNVFAGQHQHQQQTARQQESVEDKRDKSYETGRVQKKSKRGASGGGGGGSGVSQGREIKTKAVKKKYKPGQRQVVDDDSDDDTGREFSFMSLDEIVNVLEREIPSSDECSQEFLIALAKSLYETLKSLYVETAEKYYSLSTASSTADKKKSFAELQKSANQIYSNILMFEKGIKILKNDDLQNQLTKYLLRSLCSDIVNSLVLYLTTEESATIATPEARLKLINKLDANLKDAFTKLHNSLNSKSLDDFHSELDNSCQKCDIILKKVDKKRERIILSEHRQSLILQLNESNDPALTLHIAVLLLIQANYNEMIHASGKFVPALISFLQPSLESNVFSLLHQYQELVMKQLVLKDNDEEKLDVHNKLEELLPKIKQVAVIQPTKEKD